MDLAKINEKALLVSRSSALVLAAVLPFSTALTNACLAVCLLGWLLSGRVKADCACLIRHPLTWAVLAFLAFFALSSVWAHVMLASGRSCVVFKYPETKGKTVWTVMNLV